MTQQEIMCLMLGGERIPASAISTIWSRYHLIDLV